ncbi:MarR family winged helix-turn-helix transcriptional regulator [Actinocatenispora comari]|uniref:MarR family transcriptional regulator n=1 Tax=Actinocatenispora comari TaxID=2807577 RepID=A0A8J4A845_9ACTN|nr:MarR family transcriptional regulator [Actinocatenispora comari]GIL25070.1 MarR family transcriptional regulator [Actinocatenispora comari]
MHDERLANLLGAMALAIHDVMLPAVVDSSGVGVSASAALVVLGAHPGLSVSELGRRLGLSQPAAARMVDSLQEQGLVTRRKGTGRVVHVGSTRRGREATRRLLAARSAQLVDVLGSLTARQKQQLEPLLGTLLTALYRQIGDAERVCRLCHRSCCVQDALCPVGQAERSLAGG